VTWQPTPTPPSLPPPGWYPDPSGQAPHRWWDGTRWTEHVGTPPQTQAHQGIATASGTAELAGWWLRFGGYVLDAIIIGVPSYLLGLLIGDTQHGNTIPGTNVWHLGVGAQVFIVITSLLITLGYPYLLLRHNGQTVGMMAVGVRAVDRTSGVVLTAAQAARRVLAFFVIVELWEQISAIIGFHHLFGPVPLAESLFRVLAFAALLTTALWPLGNPVNQTLQDKAAGTVVVRTRS
jgi:uncharacterized RDD family membrane protein YckC